MGSLSDHWEDELLDHIMMKGDYSALSHIYVALSTADPTDDASGVAEPSGGSYARVDTEAADWNAASSRAVTNATAIEFPTATAGWGSISHWALYDASTGGNMLAHGSFSNGPHAVTTGDDFIIAAGDLSVSFNSGGIGDYLADEILDHAFMKGAWPSLSNIYVAASKANPDDDDSGIDEHSGDGYARVSTAPGDWDAASGGSLANGNEISFPAASGGNWGTITHVALYDAATAGNLLFYAALDTQKAVNDGQTLKFPVGDLTVALT